MKLNSTKEKRGVSNAACSSAPSGSPHELPPGSAAQVDLAASAEASLSGFDARVNDDQLAVRVPKADSFVHFLLQHARVPTMDLRRAGEMDPYTFEGREALIEPCNTLDDILGSKTGLPLKDSTLVLAGGAQFGKTILELYLASYVSSMRWLNIGVYLPDDGLADAIVDTKFRPIVLDNVGWFSEMTQVGRAVNKSGKSVNTKGAFLVTDGKRKAVGMFRGLKKIPTSFSMDVVVRDEEDDIARDKAKFLSGRMTASALRLQIIVGTQRIHGAGQNKQWENSSQGVMVVGPVGHTLTQDDIEHEPPAGFVNPEDHWPQICRLQMDSSPSAEDPQLSWEGDFRDRAGNVVAEYSPGDHYYLAHPDTGEELDRNRPLWIHLRPDRIKLRRIGYRISQLGCAAIDLSQIVAHWTRAVMDSEEMVSFCCDRLAKPKSAAQSLSPQLLQRSRELGPFDFGTSPAPATPRFAGLDTGDRCWLIIRETENAAVKRIFRADQIAVGDVVQRTLSLCRSNGVSALFIDERPAVTEARTIALIMNNLDGVDQWPKNIDWKSKDTYVSMPGGLTWDGRNQRWLNLRCAVVRFSKKELGRGIEQGAVEFEENGETRFVPMIACNRFETIDRVVREFLTPEQNVIEVVEVDGKKQVRQEPAMRLPRRLPGSPVILETLDNHLLTGSQRVKEDKTGELGDYVDQCDNHFLLADAYSGLAELIAGGSSRRHKFAFTSADRSDVERRAGRRVVV